METCKTCTNKTRNCLFFKCRSFCWWQLLILILIFVLLLLSIFRLQYPAYQVVLAIVYFIYIPAVFLRWHLILFGSNKNIGENDHDRYINIVVSMDGLFLSLYKNNPHGMRIANIILAILTFAFAIFDVAGQLFFSEILI